MKMVLWAAAGGAIGAAGRYLVGIGATRLLGFGFPWGTLIVNIVGSFAMGVLIETLALRFSVTQETRVFLATGILGGFTTFSAYALDVVVMMQRKEHAAAMFYMGASVGLSVMALILGLSLVRAILHP